MSREVVKLTQNEMNKIMKGLIIDTETEQGNEITIAMKDKPTNKDPIVGGNYGNV